MGHDTIDMEYNSQREHLIIPEYGRSVQKLIAHARTIEKKEDRQAFVERVVLLMHQMNPQSKSSLDSKDKLWKHLFRIAEYNLDVTPPEGVEIDPEKKVAPERLQYPDNDKKNRHYGQMILSLIAKCDALEEGDKKEEFKIVIGSFMKMAYKTWNSDHYVSEDNIKIDLKRLSKGSIVLGEDIALDFYKNSHPPRRRKPDNKHKGKGKGRKKNDRRHK